MCFPKSRISLRVPLFGISSGPRGWVATAASLLPSRLCGPCLQPPGPLLRPLPSSGGPSWTQGRHKQMSGNILEVFGSEFGPRDPSRCWSVGFRPICQIKSTGGPDILPSFNTCCEESSCMQHEHQRTITPLGRILPHVPLPAHS
jgi:hypothetical protein